MSYELHDDKGYVGQLATANGYYAMMKAAKGYPELEEFCKKGYTTEPQKCAAECRALAAKVDPDVKSTLLGFARLLDKIDEVALVK